MYISISVVQLQEVSLFSHAVIRNCGVVYETRHLCFSFIVFQMLRVLIPSNRIEKQPGFILQIGIGLSNTLDTEHSLKLIPLRCKNHLIAWLRRFVVCKYCDTDFIDVIFLTFPWTIKIKCCYVFLGYVGYMLCDQILMLTFYFNLVDITQIVKL